MDDATTPSKGRSPRVLAQPQSVSAVATVEPLESAARKAERFKSELDSALKEIAQIKEAKPKRMTSETKNRITARAYFLIIGKSRWGMAKDGDLYPRQRLVDHAYKSIYGFDKHYGKHIDSEVTRLQQLDPAERRAVGLAAIAKLRT